MIERKGYKDMEEKKIQIGILGYGNLGRGVELAIKNNPDMELVAIFTRRNTAEIKTVTGAKVVSVSEIEEYQSKIDVMILCGGSKADLPEQGPQYARLFNTVDSFDTHVDIPTYLQQVDAAAKEGNHVSVISSGWDPGLFSINRLYSDCVLPKGNTYTFWGKGVSQGHSDAIRRVEGVAGAVQYSIPKEKAVDSVRRGENPTLSAGDTHIRECYVSVKEGADRERIENEIKTMPYYFKDYETIVHFISEEELRREHSKMPHGGFVIRSGVTGNADDTKQIIEYSLNLESNPEFTSSVLVIYARAVYRLKNNGEVGAKTVFDIAPGMLSMKSRDEIVKELL